MFSMYEREIWKGLLKDTRNVYEGERNNLAVDAPCGQGEVLDGGRDYEEVRKVLASCGQG